MAMKLQVAIGLSEKLASDLSSKRGAWQRYLQTAARVYKYDFWEQLMIFGQRPDATACAEIELWNDRMGRRVNRGVCGIALIDRRHGKPRVRYVFDVGDTHLTQDSRARTPRLWSIRPEQHEAVSAALEDMFPSTEIAGLPFDEKIIKICELAVSNQVANYFAELKFVKADSLLEELDDLNLSVRFRQLLENSVAYTVLTRCGLDADLYYESVDFEYIFDFSTTAVISVLGRAVSDISRTLLLELGGLADSVEHGQKQRSGKASTAAVPSAPRSAQAETEGAEPISAPASAAQSNTDNEAEAVQASAVALSKEETQAPAAQPKLPESGCTEPPQLMEPKEKYHFSLGDTVYVGVKEYEILAYGGESVTLYDPEFPLFQEVMPRGEFDAKIAENPLNDHLLQVPEVEPQPAAPQYELGYGYLGNGLTVWNRLEQEHGDYKTIAHIDTDRTVKFYVDDLPEDIQERIRKVAATSEMTVSAAQDASRASTPSQEQEADDFSDIDPAAVRATLAENGIVDGHVADPEKLAANPFIQQVMADVEQTAQGSAEQEKPLAPPAPRRRGNATPAVLHPEIPAADRHEYQITDDAIGVGTPGERFNNNVRAIRLLKKLENENRLATPEEQAVLARYVGWGGLADCFDERHSKYAELKALLTEDEYDAARASTLNAHYTTPIVIRAVYTALRNMGFTAGNILEPSCGIGNFFGCLPESMGASKLYGVELDSLTGRIAQQLYQNASITVQGYEKAGFPRDFFDLAVGNVPFGQYQVSDKAYNRLGFSIHNYFFAKALDQVRPGGIVAFLTSRYTLDSKSPDVRRYLAKRANLLGAIRLPNNAFKASAGTKVVADIIFLQKRDRPSVEEPAWVQLGENADGFSINRYFVEHPDMILGVQTSESTQYGKQDFTVAPLDGADLAEQLAAAVRNIHGAYTEAEPAGVESAEEDKSIPADPDVRNFSYTVVDGQVYYRENSLMTPVSLSAKAAGRVKGLIGIRDCVRTLIEYQTEDYPENAIKAEQRKLNALYDAFVKHYGRINSHANNSVFNADSSYFLLTSLEVLDDEGHFVRKADMFSKRTIKQKVVVTHVDTASEALALSLSEKAKVDIPYMTELTGKAEEEIFSDLQGVIFLNPLRTGEDDGRAKYLPADEYLSGNVREKLATARLAAESDPAFQVNVEALEKVQPTDLTAAEISVRLGATWLPVEIVEQFMYELMDTPRYAQGDIRVCFSRHTGEWNISGKSRDKSSVNAYSTYGTNRANGYKIIEETLNLRAIRIFDYVEDEHGNRVAVLNKKETAIAQGKQELIKQAFQDWIWKDPKRRECLTRLYNEKFNSVRPREYDGSHLAFVGINPAITLRKHQVDAIAHILYGGNTLLAHVVGAGKTYEMVAAAMESKRLGLCQKSLFVVPNHLTEQWASEFLQLYPAANILVATKKDFETKNRKRFCGRIATGDYDAIIIGHSQFEKIPMSAERQRYVLEQQMDEIMDGIIELKENQGERFSIKQLERSKKSIQAKLDSLNDQTRKDDVVTFEELGVDRLFIDEAHYYKNLAAFSKMRNVGGISQTEAQKSSDLYMKCRYLDELTGGRGVVFATGTPISNTMVEMFTMQKYLQYDMLQKNDLLHFDAWASTFGETVTAIELAPEGTGYRAKTRFSRFYNLPELMAMFKEVADIQTADMLNLPVPKANYHNIVLKPSELQKEMVAALGERAEKVRNRIVDPSVDNMLKITNDGRKLALDQRLMNEMLPESETGKVNACAENVFAIWRRTAAQRSTQMVFCDLSTPHNDGHFNVYDALRDKLTAMGVPAGEIAYIHNAKSEAQKKELFGKVRSGQIRVLIGSTQKMGAGTNVQQKLVALHHLDCPWRPADLQQREGRIIRQGNENPEVDIYTYVTENTFDSYLYQLVEGKQKFIGQIMTSKSPVRSAEDIDETALSYAEIKALCTGNPLIKERMDLDIDVQRLKLLKSNYLSQRYALEDKIAKYLPQEIRLYEQRIAGYEADAAYLAENTRPNADGFSPMTVEGKTYDGKKAAGSAILEACHAMTSPEPVPLGQYRGFDMVLYFDSISREYRATLSHQMSYTVALGNDLYGNITRIDNALAGIEGQRAAASQQLENAKRQLANAQEQAARPFPQEDELKTKSARLDELNIALNLDKRENEGMDDGGEELAMAS